MQQVAYSVTDEATAPGTAGAAVLGMLGVRLGLKATRLRRVAGQLTDLNEETAGEFLELGSRLQEAASRAREISTLATEVTQAAGGDEAGSDGLLAMADTAANTVEKLRDWQQDLNAIPDSLSQVIEDIMAVMTAGVEWHKFISKNLRVVRMYTAIEAAHLKSHHSRVEAFCAELAESADHIGADGRVWQKRTGEATTNLDLALRNIAEGIAQFGVGVEASEATLSMALADLGGIVDRASSGTSSVASVADEISAEVSEVVASLQFHDIARQRIEHVQEALIEVADTFERSGEDAEALTAETLSHAWSTLALQEAQLAKVIAGADDAVETIRDGLEGIANRCYALAAETDGLRLAGGTDAFARVHQCVDDLTDSLRTGSGLARTTVASVQEVAGIAADTNRWAEESRATSDELLMLGLNALIMTANLREDGRTLTVCADEIGKTVRVSAEMIAEAEGKLEGIVERAEQLGNETEEARERHASRCAGDRKELDACLDVLEELHERIAEAGRIARQSSQELTEDIAGTLKSVRFDDRMHQRLQGTIKQVRQIQDMLEEAGYAAPAGTDIEHLRQRYTMADERQTHDSIFVDNEEQPDLVLIDTPEDAGDEVQAEGDAEDGLGDNVELF